MLIGTYGNRCSNATAGDANNAEVPKISRSITFSREAAWEVISKKI